MASWFDDSINKHEQALKDEEAKRDEAELKAERERDEFRAGFEFAVENTVLPAFETFSEGARNHGFTSSFRKELDARGRLRAMMLGIYAKDDQPVANGGFDHCTYKVTLQMSTRRIAHMMSFDNVAGAARQTKNDFLDLGSLEETTFQDRCKEFLDLSLRYCQGPH